MDTDNELIDKDASMLKDTYSEDKMYPELEEDMDRWPINRLYSNKDFVIKEIIAFAMQKFDELGPEEIEKTLAKTIYTELVRVRTNPWKVDPPNEKTYWKKLENELNSNNQSAYKDELNREMLQRIINRYAQEISGDFNPKTFRFARRLLTSIFKKIFNRAYFSRFYTFWGKKKDLAKRMKMLGHIETMRALFKKGTVVLLPNHISNIDSILIGYGVDLKLGLPAFSYGAGLNLYDYELLAFLISKLGAYKLDRRKRNAVYLTTLKAFSTITMLKGVNTIFFPGGTRSRSGEFEKSAKLGLMSTLLESQRMMSERQLDKKIFIVPVHLGYHFVLEAGFFVEDYLTRQGKEDYLKGKKTSIGLGRILRFMRDLWRKDSDVFMHFGTPVDVFGNRVDDEGNSYDANGKMIDITDYYKLNGFINYDEQRERQYTFQLGKKIIDSYKEENIILDSQLVSFLAFEYFRRAYADVDFYALFNLPNDALHIPLDNFEEIVESALAYLNKLNEKMNLTLYDMDDRSALDIIVDGVKHVGVYHKNRPLKIVDYYVGTESSRLLYYYHNRLIGYNLESVFDHAKIKHMEL